MKQLLLSVGIAMLAGLSLTSCESCPFDYSSDDGVSCCCTEKGNDCGGNCGCGCASCEV